MTDQRVVPMLSYEDAGRAADWICRSFGFEEVERFGDERTVTHVTLKLGEGIVFLGNPGPEYRGPRKLAESCEAARRMLETPYVVDGVLVEVDDIDAHYERAQAAGATILTELEDNSGVGQRQYRVEDLEGHRWMFAQPT
ncbi:MAG TPA: VOC family protein [Gaiellaceae bacterium]|nr:VOC family protein [Gaiellaceae bacterium]